MSQESIRGRLMGELKKAMRHLDRPNITQEEAVMYSDLTNTNDLAFYYGSFEKARQEAWSEIQREKAAEAEPSDEVADKQKRIQQSAAKMRREALIEWLINEERKVGRKLSPISDVKKKYPEKYKAILDEFGMWAHVETAMLEEKRRQKEAQSSRDEGTPETTSLGVTRRNVGEAQDEVKDEAKDEVEDEAKDEVVVEEVKSEDVVAEKVEVEESVGERPTTDTGQKPKRRRRSTPQVEELVAYLIRLEAELGTIPNQAQLLEYAKTHDDGYAYTTLVRYLGPKREWPLLVREARLKAQKEQEVAEHDQEVVDLDHDEPDHDAFDQEAAWETSEILGTAEDEGASPELRQATSEAETSLEEVEVSGEPSLEDVETSVESSLKEVEAQDGVERIEITLGRKNMAFRVELDGQKYEIVLNLAEDNA